MAGPPAGRPVGWLRSGLLRWLGSRLVWCFSGVLAPMSAGVLACQRASQLKLDNNQMWMQTHPPGGEGGGQATATLGGIAWSWGEGAGTAAAVTWAAVSSRMNANGESGFVRAIS